VRRATALTLAGALLLAAALLVAAALVRMHVTVSGSGTLEPTRVWPVRARVSGAVTTVLVAAGDTVRAGQLLARLDTHRAAVAVRRLEAQVAARRVEGARAAIEAPLERRQLEAGLAQAEARRLQARAMLRQQMAEFGFGGDVDSVLRDFRPGRHVALDRSVAEVLAADGEIMNARLRLRRSALASLDAERRRHEQGELEAQLLEQREARDRAAVTAPAEGVVLTDDLEALPNAVLREGDVVLEVAEPGSWRAVLRVRERDVHRIRVGERALIEVGALSAVRREPIPGRVVSVAGDLGSARDGPPGAASPDPGGSAGYRVVVALDRASVDSLGGGVLRRGYTVRAKIVTRSARALALVHDWVLERVSGRAP
jgi:multidrug resistance efflux pump